MQSAKQYLSALGLNPSKKYTTNELKDQWRAKCKEHHPDKGGDPNKFREVTHAFKMLTDPEYQVHEAKKRPERDLHIRMVVPVKFEDAFFGRTILLNFNRTRVKENLEPEEDQTNQIIESVKITIPPGSFDGHEEVFSGKGLIQGEHCGDCHIKIQVLRHAQFMAEGKDIISQIQIPMDLALKGGTLEVPTMYGLKTLKIPPGTQPGERLCVGDYGVNRAGKHYAIVDPVYPSKEELKSNKWSGLGIHWEEEEKAQKIFMEDNELEKIFETLVKAAQHGIRF